MVKHDDRNHNDNNSEQFNHGLELFNTGHFFDAHEVLEDVWRPMPTGAALRRHVQGMVQLAVAFHHHSTGNHVGALSVLQRAIRNLAGADNSFPQLDLIGLRRELALWQRFLNQSVHEANESARAQVLRPAPARPKINRRNP